MPNRKRLSISPPWQWCQSRKALVPDYAERVAAWSQPLDASESGFRVGHGSYNAKRSLDADRLVWAFFGPPLTPPPTPPPYGVLDGPVVIACIDGRFDRSIHRSIVASLGGESFLQFVDVLEALMAVESSSSVKSFAWSQETPCRPLSVEATMRRANAEFFRPRQLICWILPLASTLHLHTDWELAALIMALEQEAVAPPSPCSQPREKLSLEMHQALDSTYRTPRLNEMMRKGERDALEREAGRLAADEVCLVFHNLR